MDLPPVYAYAVETAIQLTLTERNENLRDIYIEAYASPTASEYIFRNMAEELYQIFHDYSRVAHKVIFMKWKSVRRA